MELLKKHRDYIQEQMNLKSYSLKCVNLFVKYIEEYETEAGKAINDSYVQKVICHVQVFDGFRMFLGFLSLPGLGNHMEILDEEDNHFFKKPLFFHSNAQERVGILIAKKIDESNGVFKDFKDYDVDDYNHFYIELQLVYESIIEKWLRICWLEANKIQSVSYPLYYFYHDYSHKSINLLDGKHYDLEKLSTQ